MISTVLLLTLLLAGQCGSGGCGVSQGSYSYPMPTYQPGPQARPRPQPSPWQQADPRQNPTIVHIVSVKGDEQMRGTGTVVATDATSSLVLTCAHILAAGYQPMIGQDSLTILAADALHDTALLLWSRPNRAFTSIQPAGVATEATVRWLGYSAQGFVGANSRIQAKDSDRLTITGRVPDGVSGGPICDSRFLVGIVCDCVGNERGEWTTRGASAEWLRGFVAAHWPPLPAPPLPTPPIPAGPLVAVNDVPAGSEKASASSVTSVPPTPPAIDPCLDLRERLATLEKTVANLKTLRGPPGPPGKDGKDGKDGATPSIDYGVIVGGLPPIRIRTLNLDGSKHQEATARLGDLIILEPIAVKAEAKK